jgi:hypothetical protein
MGLGGILQELKTEGVLALYHDYRSGRLVDYSGNGRDGVGTGVSFTKDGAQFTPLTANITVPYGAWMTAPAISMIVSCRLPLKIGTDRLVSRRSGTTTFDWYFQAATINIYEGVLDTSLAYAGLNNVFGVSIVAATTTTGYLNGVLSGNYLGASTLNVTTHPMIIGNLLAGSSCLTNKIMGYFVYITRSLTATEHARIYAQLENMTWNTKGLTPGPMMP